MWTAVEIATTRGSQSNKIYAIEGGGGGGTLEVRPEVFHLSNKKGERKLSALQIEANIRFLR